MQPVDISYGRINLPADPLLLGRVVAFEHDARGIEVVHLIERYMLGLHLVPDGIGRFYPRLGRVFQPHLVQTLKHRRGEILVYAVTRCLGGRDLFAYAPECLRMLVLETQVLQFGLYLEQPQTVGQRCVDVERLAGNLVLLVGRHRPQSAHVVQAVGHLYEHHADILRHGQQQFAEILCLCRSLVAEDTARNLSKPFHQLGYLLAEVLLNVLHRIVGVLHHVVQQSGTYGGGAKADFLTGNLGHGYWM